MTLLAPSWLLAAMAILIPIAIHLWNKRQGKTVKVGSIRWLEASSSKQWSRIRLTDIWLLFLRCLILIILAVALAKPVLEKYTVTQPGEKAVFISPELLYSEAVASLKATIDPLLLRGYTLYIFTPTFTSLSQEQWVQLSFNPIDSVVESGNYWGLLPALAQKYPMPQDSIWLFTSDQQRHFQGKPAPLQSNITWIPVTLQKTTNWLQAAYATATDSISIITGQSSPAGTSYTRQQLARTNAPKKIGNLEVRLLQQNDTLWAYWEEQLLQKVMVQQSPMHVSLITSRAQQPEARYIQAAVTAISAYTGIPIVVSKGMVADTTDWLFWLSADPVPDSIMLSVQQGMQLWVQPGANPTTTTASLVSAGHPIRLHQVSDSSTIQEQVIWSASNGEALLTSEQTGSGNLYYFRSGFSPAWSRLGQSEQLPDLLASILLPEVQQTKYDARVLPDELLKPTIKEVNPDPVQEEQNYNLFPWLVLLAALLFLLERYIAGSRVKV